MPKYRGVDIRYLCPGNIEYRIEQSDLQLDISFLKDLDSLVDTYIGFAVAAAKENNELLACASHLDWGGSKIRHYKEKKERECRAANEKQELSFGDEDPGSEIDLNYWHEVLGELAEISFEIGGMMNFGLDIVFDMENKCFKIRRTSNQEE